MFIHNISSNTIVRLQIRKIFRKTLDGLPIVALKLKCCFSVRNIPKFKDRANWSRATFQPMRRRACVYQQTNQNIAPVIKNFQNNGWSRTESVIVSIFKTFHEAYTIYIHKWTAYRKPYWKCLVKYSAHFVAYFFFYLLNNAMYRRDFDRFSR